MSGTNPESLMSNKQFWKERAIEVRNFSKK